MHVFRKELRALVTSPQAWAIATAYFILSGIFFVAILFSDAVPDLERYYSNIETTLIVIAPIMAMRSFAEERRSGVLDITMSWPVSRWSLVLGKFAADVLFTWTMISVTWLYVILLNNRAATFEIGKAAAGYCGLLMLSTMFTAVAVAVSARSKSPTAAVFVGFGSLLGLWILDYVPGWLGGRFNGIVEFLAPTYHVTNSGRGVLDLGDAFYFLMGTIFGLTLAATALRERRFRGWKSPLRNVGLVLGLAVVLGTGFVSANANGQLDLTPQQRFTLTKQSKKVVSEIHDPIEITGLAQPGTAEQLQMASLVRSYQLVNPNITLTVIDPEAQPSKAKALGVTAYGEMVLKIHGRSEVVTNINEVDLTSAMQRISHPTPPTVCFTVGHGERSIDDARPVGYQSFSVELAKLGYVTESLALAAVGGPERLQTCSVVVVAGPRALFLPQEFAMLQNFAEQQGRLVVLASSDDAVTKQLNDLIRPWGLTIRSGFVHDHSSLMNDSGALIAFNYPSASPVTNELKDLGIPLLLVGAQSVESALLTSTKGSQAWLSSLVESSTKSSLDDKTKGPFVLGAITDWSQVDAGAAGVPVLARTRIGVLGTDEVASNHFIGQFGNLTFSTKLVSWVGVENDIIAAIRDPSAVTKIALTPDDRGSLIRWAIVVPGAAALLLFGVCLLRTRRG